MSTQFPIVTVLRGVLKERKHKILFLSIIFITVSGSLLAGIGVSLFIPVIELISKGNVENVSRGFTQKIFLFLDYVHLKHTLLIFVVIIFFCVFLHALLDLLRKILSAKMRDGITKSLRDKAFDNLMYVSSEFYHSQKVGKLTSYLADEALRGGVTFYTLSQIISTTSIILIFVVLLFLISWKATIFSLIMLMISIFSIKGIIRSTRKLGQQKGDYKSLITTFCFEHLSNFFLINIFNYQELAKRKFSRLTEQIKNNLKRLSLHKGLIEFYNATIMVLSVSILVYFLYEILNLSIGYLVTILFVISQLSPRINTLGVLFQTFSENNPGLRNIYSLSLREDKPYMQNGNKKLSRFKSHIVFKDVYFRYSPDKMVLEQINMTIERGKITAIIGASGSGKSTLISLIPRVYDVTKGEILIDDISIKKLNMYTWREKIGFISQETYIFNDTIKSNLLIANPDATEKELIKATKFAHIYNLIEELPKKFESIVGDRGLKLSGGQMQRIAIARVFLRNPEILILDEATSSLDAISERLIQQSIDELSKSRTVIVVAHRLTTIKNVDKIFVLEEGRIVEEGEPHELIESGGYYQKYLKVAENRHASS